jgi:hypothetical protein
VQRVAQDEVSRQIAEKVKIAAAVLGVIAAVFSVFTYVVWPFGSRSMSQRLGTRIREQEKGDGRSDG